MISKTVLAFVNSKTQRFNGLLYLSDSELKSFLNSTYTPSVYILIYLYQMGKLLMSNEILGEK